MNKIKLTLAMVLTAMTFNVMALESNPIKQCEPEVKAGILTFKTQGFKYGEIANLLAIRAADGKTFTSCQVDTEKATHGTGMASASCNGTKYTSRYYGWYAEKAQ